ncbi:MAG TPA: hypothetical protein PK629_04555 [Oscillospiraceae bacterium]|nr:hypothetical protein [Oscillospiraceae bacterium]HPF56399.1 hypothetical protein [Clostridiales bacterium]HPK34817.1 hypothetical protein [Oscillospiraceae bacterium]HPR76777.1 hypothetical protein [Oscillospiraceae bacterium]
MSKLADVNTTDLRAAIEASCKTMCSVFNADDNNIPFFTTEVYPEVYMAFHPSLSESHVPGRHLNALLTAQDLLGIPIGEENITKHAEAAFFSYSGPVLLPLNREIEGQSIPNRLLIHNIREGFHALYALVKYRGSERAKELAEKSIAEIHRFWNPDTDWDIKRLEECGVTVVSRNSFIQELGRSIGPLVKYYRATGYAPALELALTLKEKAITEYYKPDGDFDPKLFGTTHTHSVTCVMSSLAQLGDLLQDAELIERVRAFYDNGLWKLRDELGWAVEAYGSEKNPDRGETNSSGDIVETALILGKWGYPQYYQDAERILRGHLLPSQLRDVSFIRDPKNPQNKDGLRDVAKRHFGAYGFPAPYGHFPADAGKVKFNMDIVGGTVGSLCEAYHCAVTYEDGVHRVNLLFDLDNENISVQSLYTHDSLKIVLKQPGALFVRIPSWVDRERITVDGAKPGGFHNGYLFLSKTAVNQLVTIHFKLVKSEMVLRHRTRDIRVRMLGDRVVAMDNFGMDHTFFDAID